jgi:hypothetical protein
MGFIPAYSKLLRAKGWTNNWQHFEKITSNITAIIQKCIKDSSDGVLAPCDIESGVEYLDPSRK